MCKFKISGGMTPNIKPELDIKPKTIAIPNNTISPPFKAPEVKIDTSDAIKLNSNTNTKIPSGSNPISFVDNPIKVEKLDVRAMKAQISQLKETANLFQDIKDLKLDLNKVESEYKSMIPEEGLSEKTINKFPQMKDFDTYLEYKVTEIRDGFNTAKENGFKGSISDFNNFFEISKLDEKSQEKFLYIHTKELPLSNEYIINLDRNMGKLNLSSFNDSGKVYLNSEPSNWSRGDFDFSKDLETQGFFEDHGIPDDNVPVIKTSKRDKEGNIIPNSNNLILDDKTKIREMRTASYFDPITKEPKVAVLVSFAIEKKDHNSHRFNVNDYEKDHKFVAMIFPKDDLPKMGTKEDIENGTWEQNLGKHMSGRGANEDLEMKKQIIDRYFYGKEN